MNDVISSHTSCRRAFSHKLTPMTHFWLLILIFLIKWYFCNFISFSMAQIINNPGRSPNWIEATLGGRQSALVGIFKASVCYDGIRASILQHLHNGDFNKMRRVCRSMDLGLTIRASGFGPHRLRYQSDLRDKCDEIALPVPPSLPPRGTCPNVLGSWYRVLPCQHNKYPLLRDPNPHHILTRGRRRPKQQLVCYGCRSNWHHNIGTNPGAMNPNAFSRHDFWRRTLARGHITVCRLCDREQKSRAPPEGFDGCTCYRELYKKRWLCKLCDIKNGTLAMRKINSKMMHEGRLKQVGNFIQIMPAAQVPRQNVNAEPLCPCWRRNSEVAPFDISIIPNPFTSNQDMIRPVQTGRVTKKTTKQCVRCCGYIVPPVAGAAIGTRRSARLADRKLKQRNTRKHVMLGSQAVNRKGFPARGRGWA